MSKDRPFQAFKISLTTLSSALKLYNNIIFLKILFNQNTQVFSNCQLMLYTQ